MNSKQQEIKLLEELRHFGTPLDETILENIKAISENLEIGQYGAQLENVIYLKTSGILGVMINLCIENNSDRIVRIADIRLRMPWFNDKFQWIPKQPRRVLNQWGGYVLPACGAYGFDASDVINHRLGSNCKLCPGDALLGLLLGEGTASVPTHFIDRSKIPMELTVFTSRNQEFSTVVELVMSRDLKEPTATATHKRVPGLNKQERKPIAAAKRFAVAV